LTAFFSHYFYPSGAVLWHFLRIAGKGVVNMFILAGKHTHIAVGAIFDVDD
jgi:hypothetical protein